MDTSHELYHKILSIHQEESDINTVDNHSIPNNGTNWTEQNMTQLPLVYNLQDKYKALYDLILNPAPVVQDDPIAGSPEWLLSKIVKYRRGCLCGTRESGSNGQMEHVCPSGEHVKFETVCNTSTMSWRKIDYVTRLRTVNHFLPFDSIY